MLYNDPFLSLPFTPAKVAAVHPVAHPVATAGGAAQGVAHGRNMSGEMARTEQLLKTPGATGKPSDAQTLEASRSLANPLISGASRMRTLPGIAVGALGGLAADMASGDKDSSTLGHVLGGAALGGGLAHLGGQAARAALPTAAGSHAARYKQLRTLRDTAASDPRYHHMIPDLEREMHSAHQLAANELTYAGDTGGGIKRLDRSIHADPATPGGVTTPPTVPGTTRV